MLYRVELANDAAQQIDGLPAAAKYALRRTLSLVIEDPHDPTLTEPADRPDFRCAIFGGFGYVEFQPWDELKVVLVHKVIWAD